MRDPRSTSPIQSTKKGDKLIEVTIVDEQLRNHIGKLVERFTSLTYVTSVQPDRGRPEIIWVAHTGSSVRSLFTTLSNAARFIKTTTESSQQTDTGNRLTLCNIPVGLYPALRAFVAYHGYTMTQVGDTDVYRVD